MEDFVDGKELAPTAGGRTIARPCNMPGSTKSGGMDGVPGALEYVERRRVEIGLPTTV